jgi:hypothetical protein
MQKRLAALWPAVSSLAFVLMAEWAQMAPLLVHFSFPKYYFAMAMSC